MVVLTSRSLPIPERLQQEGLLISTICKNRGITELFHFTRIDNLETIFSFGLVSLECRFPVKRKISDPTRKDGRTKHISLSVSFPNFKMFYDIRTNRYPSDIWCVISIDPIVLAHVPCLFFQENAASYGNIRMDDARQSAEAFEKMFRDRNRPPDLPACFPSDPQAEVQAEGIIKQRFFRSVNFQNEKDLQHFYSLHIQPPDGVNVCTRSELFDSGPYYLKRHRRT